jgi:hypothetical protein
LERNFLLYIFKEIFLILKKKKERKT